MHFERMAEAMGLTQADLHTYGAEDAEELISILQALEQADGHVDPWLRPGGAWERASVAVEVLGVSRWTARQRPSPLPIDMIEEVDEVVAELRAVWLVCMTADEARGLKRRLWSEYKPAYNIL